MQRELPCRGDPSSRSPRWTARAGDSEGRKGGLVLELLDSRYRAWIACELFHVDRHHAQRLLNDRRVRRLGASRVEGRLGIVFHCELRKLCRVVAAQLREYHQTEVDSGGHAATRDP